MLQINKDGLQTTMQDLGRTGFQKYGVIASGVMDPYAHRLANILVDNEETEPTIEITLMGPHITFHSNCVFALTGGNLSPAIDGIPIKMWRPIVVKKGCKLTFGKPISGCRAYLAVAGGFDVPEVMGSRSTYLRAGIGGFEGRALQKGDILQLGECSTLVKNCLMSISKEENKLTFIQMDWTLMAEAIPTYKKEAIVRIIDGRQAHLFDEKSKDAFFNQAFQISSDSDRMGYRLNGQKLALKEPKELISEAVSFGSIQVPSDGQPIVLMADRQTTGGYPKIGQVTTVDLPKVSQLKPGEYLRFERISLEEAQHDLINERGLIKELKQSISLKFKARI
ncbi:biotin-dependent carboxyltransferase family protein [Paenisporosarcina sp. TG20]|uniref:5-oxoprolinase subunit C family protein n=1 Tax=Paenisporosarcina sp. TG20 TaxID=1211706 RepID=UPI0003001AA1|nr:biotin-dependent carboxyltransferase family protein [Paenisporosarcina sp. TG20]